MLFQTQSNRIYSYSPSSNRLSTKIDEDADAVHTEYELSSVYDFSQIGMYTIEMTQQCNLRCKYCCYSGNYSNRRTHNSSEISFDNLSKCINFIAEHTPKNIPVIYVSFYGGEALICQEKIMWFIKYLGNRCPDKSFEFSVSTNGILLTDTVIDWICNTPNLYLTITIDGGKVMHDRNRITASGGGSFDTITRNLSAFKIKNPVLFKKRVRFISTVKSIVDLIPLNDFWMNNDLLRDNRPQHISSIIPNFDKGDCVLSDLEKFMMVFNKGLSHYQKGIEDILTDELQNLIKPVRRRDYRILSEKLCVSTCLNAPSSCFISSQGDIYVCERLCSQYRLGTLTTDFDQTLCETFNKRYILRKNTYCSNCWAQRLCRRCLTGLNFNEDQFNQFCANEKMQVKLALKYYCELLEFKTGIR